MGPMGDCVPNDSRADCQPLDEAHPERWYLPPHKKGVQVANASWRDSDATLLPAIGEVHSMRYKIPENLACEHCTLQWYYSTGNSCLYDGGYITYFNRMAELGWSVAEWVYGGDYGGMASWVTCENSCCGPSGTGGFGEEFWNCADIAVRPFTSGQGGSSTDAPAATTTSESSVTSASTTPASSATTSTTMAAATASTSSASSGACAEEWGQCGGQDWTGSTCCASGLTCVKQTIWFSICEPSSAVGAETTTIAGSTSAAATAAPVTTCCASCYFCNAL